MPKPVQTIIPNHQADKKERLFDYIMSPAHNYSNNNNRLKTTISLSNLHI